MGYILAVALLTWGGVFLYLLRLGALLKQLQARDQAAREAPAGDPRLQQ